MINEASTLNEQLEHLIEQINVEEVHQLLIFQPKSVVQNERAWGVAPVYITPCLSPPDFISLSRQKQTDSLSP